MIPTLASIFLDYKCNFSCTHCSVGSNPHISMPMPRSTLHTILEQIHTMPSIKVVVFTGGETTLRKDLLLEGIAMAKKSGYVTRIVTNGWWARTADKAKAFVKDLTDAGLDELNASYDDYHIPFLPIDNLFHLVRAGLDANLRVAIAVVKDHAAKYNSESVRQALSTNLGMSIQEIEQKLVIIDDNPTPTGTGENLDTAGFTPHSSIDSGCDDMMGILSFHPNGNVKACCGHAMFYNGDLNVGNLQEESLGEVVQRGQKNAVYWWIHTLGPKRILERLGVEGEYTSQCHACNVLLGDHRDKMINYLGEHKEEIMVRDVIFNDRLKVVTRNVLSQKESVLQKIGKA